MAFASVATVEPRSWKVSREKTDGRRRQPARGVLPHVLRHLLGPVETRGDRAEK
jgi:hypothetical protein